MKIVFLSHSGNCVGGAQFCLVSLIKGIKIKYPNVEIYLIVDSDAGVVDACKEYIEGYKEIKTKWWLYKKKLRLVPFIKTWGIKKNINETTSRIVEYLDLIKPDFAVTNSIVVPQLAMACKKRNLKHIWFLHEIPMITWGNHKFLYSNKKILAKIEELSHKVIVPSDFVKRYYEKFFLKNIVSELSQTVEIERIESDEKENKRYCVLMLGAVEENKGQMEFIKAVKIVVDQGVDVRAVIVGKANKRYLEKCTEYVKGNRMDQYVEFVEFSNEVAKCYQEADVVVNCSGMETFGRVAVEAQLFGIPVVLSAVGANVERVVEDQTGYLYNKGDVSGLASKIAMLADEKNRERIIENIKGVDFNRYSVNEFVKNFMDIAVN